MLYDMWKARGHNAESNWLLLILDSLVFFLSFIYVTRHILIPVLTFLLWFSFIFLTELIRFGLQRWRRKNCGGGGKLLIFFESACGIIIWCCCSAAAGGEPCLLYLIRTESMTALIKNPMKALRHTNTPSICSITLPFL